LAIEEIMKRSALFAALLCLAAPSASAALEGRAATLADAAPDAMVEMAEIRVPIIDAGRLDGILRIKIVLQAQNKTAAARLPARMPELNAAGLSAAIEFARLYASPFSPVDVEKLVEALTPSLQRAAPGIAKIYIVHISAMSA
jgi:hypothetical protein